MSLKFREFQKEAVRTLNSGNREAVIAFMHDIAYKFMNVSKLPQLGSDVLIFENSNIKVYSLSCEYKYKKCIGEMMNYTNDRFYI